MAMNKQEKKLILKLTEKNNIRYIKGWKNFSENLNSPKSIVLDVEDIQSLKSIVSTVNNLNQEKKSKKRILLRVAAGGREECYSESFSFTPGVEADIIIRLVGNEFREVKTTAHKNIMCVGASVQIGELDKELYDKHNLTLSTSSLIPYVTVAGLAANSGHGTGKDQPSFSGLIRAMTVCLPTGEIVRIDNTHKDFEAIRAANMGLFGIVLSVELECIEAKKMECIMDVTNLPDFIKKVKAGLFLNYPYVSVMYVPTYQENEMTSDIYNNVIIYSWTPVDKNTPDENSFPRLAHLTQQLEINLEKNLHVTDLISQFSHLIPYYTRYLLSNIAIGKEDKKSIGPWHTVHYQTAFPKNIDDADYLFQVGKDSSEIVVAMEKIVNTLSKFAANEKYPIVDAIYLRFFAGTNGGLSTSAHKEGNYVCGLDMVSSNNIPGYQEFKSLMAHYFINSEIAAKPHWGKYVPLTVDYREMYGKNYDIFVQALSDWYQNHNIKIENSMFLNQFHCEVLQLPYQPNLIKQEYPDYKKTKVNTREIANILSNNIDENNLDGLKLKRRLQVISNDKIDNNKASFFDKQSKNKNTKINANANNNLNNTKSQHEEEKKSSCVIF
jgi:hypothetical protein